MLASSSPPNVSRPRHGPFSRPTTLTPFSVRTLATAAPEAPAPMMHASARAGFVLFATIGLEIFLFLAFCEPGQRAVAAGEHFQQRRGSGEADHFPPDLALVSPINRVGVEALPRVHREQRHKAEFGLGERLLKRRPLVLRATRLRLLAGQSQERFVLPTLVEPFEFGAECLPGERVERCDPVDVGLAQDLDALPPRVSLLADEGLEAAAVRLGVDELDPRKVTVDEINRAGLSRPWFMIGGDDTRHGGLYRRPLVRVEESLVAHSLASSAAVSVCALKSSEAAWTPPSFPRLANGDGDDDDHSPCDQLLAVFEAHQQEPVVDDADHQRSDNGADHRSRAP